MRKILFYIVLITFLLSGVIQAQTEPTLPNAGLTPANPFYFLDTLSEKLSEFFTFNPEGKARLQIKFAAERVAEIQVIFEKKAPKKKHVDIATSKLQASVAKAVLIIGEEKSKGEDVSTLAQELSDTFSLSKSLLKRGLKEQERVLDAEEDELESRIRVALRAVDSDEVESLTQELSQVKIRQELLELKEEELEEELEREEELLEETLEIEAEASKKIQKAEREKQEVLQEAQKEGVTLPTNAFMEFDQLLTQAKIKFDTENFEEAKRLAKKAKKSLDAIEDIIDELEDALDAKEDAEEAIEEAEEKLAETRAEAVKEGVELPPSAFVEFNSFLFQAKTAFDIGEFEEAERLAEQAEEALDNVEDIIDELEDDDNDDDEEEDDE